MKGALDLFLCDCGIKFENQGLDSGTTSLTEGKPIWQVSTRYAVYLFKWALALFSAVYLFKLD